MKYKRHWSYLKYIIKHKWYVSLAAKECGCSIFTSITHDLSKFLPSEWFPYAYTFYDDNGEKRYQGNIEFNIAWNHHQKKNGHHWQYWLLKMDKGDIKPLPMPDKYIKEMVADWMGAGRVINGKWEVMEWYQKNKNTIIIHPETRTKVEYLLKEVWDYNGGFFLTDLHRRW